MATRIPGQVRRPLAERSSQQEEEAAPFPQSAQSPRPRSPSQARSHASDDSQTVVLSHKDANTSLSASQTSKGDEEAAMEENLHCWICLADEPLTEREAGNWRSPCSCILTAHEDCLFQWIASQKEDTVNCPQCKTEIKIAQPHDYIIDLVNYAKNFVDIVALPAGLVAISSITYTGLLVYGTNAVALVFGSNVAQEMSTFALHNPFVEERLLLRIMNGLKLVACPFSPKPAMDWKFLVGLPMIAPVLILSRFKAADTVFGIVPMIWCVYKVFVEKSTDMPHWPPSPEVTLAALPYFRFAYDELYSRLFKNLEREWEKAVQRQPREGETAEDVARAQNARDEDQHQIEVGIEIVNEDEDDAGRPPNLEQVEEAIRQVQMARNGEPRNIEQVEEALRQGQIARNAWAAGQQNANPARPRAGAIDQQGDAWEHRLNFRTDGVGTSIVGALFMPAISFVVGSIIKYTFPKTWVTPPSIRSTWRSSRKLTWSEGFLQSQFGRSIAGGCLFIVLKDAVLLYYKWKRAKNFGKRRILDYQGKKNDVRSSGAQ